MALQYRAANNKVSKWITCKSAGRLDLICYATACNDQPHLQHLVYHPECNLGIREEWLPKHPVFVLNQDDLTNDNDAELRHRIGAIEDNKLIEVISDKQLIFLLEVPMQCSRTKMK